MFHWCPDETAALLASLPMVGVLVRWLKIKLSRKRALNRAGGVVDDKGIVKHG